MMVMSQGTVEVGSQGESLVVKEIQGESKLPVLVVEVMVLGMVVVAV